MLRRSFRILPSATLAVALAVLVRAAPAFADVFSYEGSAFPEDGGWLLLQNYCYPELWVEEGWFHQHVEMCPGDPPNGGQGSVYRRSLEEYIGEEEFFIEWVVETDAERTEINWGGGVDLSAGGQAGVNYHFGIAGDQAELVRDPGLPIIHVDITPGPHTYRLELFGAELYVWYIDGVIVNSGVPEGAYPVGNPIMNIRNKAAWAPNLTRWDYIRYGRMPIDGRGDFDSDGEVDEDDLYYFQECFSSEAGNWAGCRWADMDFDGGVDCDDWFLFLEAWTDPADLPGMPECAHPPDFDGDGCVGPFDLALLLGSWGPCADPPADCPADLDGDGSVGAADLAVLLGSWGPCP